MSDSDPLTVASAHTGSTLADVASLIGASVPTISDVAITGVSDDSRTVQPGDLYLGFPGVHVHGLDFEADARARGAVATLSNRVSAVLPTILVEDPRRWAGPISARIYGNPSHALDVFGVTGTNGKTSTTYLLDAALAAAGETVGTITGIGISGPAGVTSAVRTTPEAAPLQKALATFRDTGATVAAMEVSSHASAQGRINGTRFAAMGFTNLSRDHLDFHGSMEAYFAAKAALFVPERTRAAAIGVDDEYGRRLAASTDLPTWTCSTVDRAVDIFADGIECGASGTSFTARTPVGDFHIWLSLLGPHQVRNALMALTLLAATGRDLAAAATGFERVRCVPGRLERVDAGQSFLALVDYMHNTAGQRQSLPYLQSLATGKVIVVIGATGDRDVGKRFPLGATAATLADIVIVSDESPYSEEPDRIRAAVTAGAASARKAEVLVEPDRRSAFDLAVTLAEPGDVVVAAGRGCDSVQRYGNDVRHFDDRHELRRALQTRMSAELDAGLRGPPSELVEVSAVARYTGRLC